MNNLQLHTMRKEYSEIKTIVDAASRLVVVQADNPDADSLGSALALEHILSELGKEVFLYCGVDIPTYLRYLPGWDRVSSDMPKELDASVLVDVSTQSLLERLYATPEKSLISKRPCVVLDHHATVDDKIPFSSVELVDGNRSSTGELIFVLAKELGWDIPVAAGEAIMAAILGDTQGLTNQLTSVDTYLTMADLARLGVDRSDLEARRRELSKMDEMIYRYKGRLLQRTEIAADGKLAYVVVTNDEIRQYSPLYNPGPLVQNDMLQIKDVEVAVVLKNYDDGRITAAIRSNLQSPIAGQLASSFGGGGHDYASGFKITDNRRLQDVITELTANTSKLLVNNTNSPD